MRIVKPGFNFDIKHYEKKLEDKKKAEASKGEAKPAESLNLSQKLESTSGNIAKLIKKDEAPKEETMDSLDDQDEEIAKLKTKPKVYGVAPKPAPRNIKENEYESGTVEDLDWTPPVDKFNAKQEELKKKLGY